MKNFLVIGNPIEHSISPKIHNYWFKKNGIKATYDKILLIENQLGEFINRIRSKEIYGANITVPFKEKIIPFIDTLSNEARESNSVNTIYLSNDKVVGHNTDIEGFYLSLKNKKLNFRSKNSLILGSGGVTPSIIIALKKLGVDNIIVSNRTKEKAIRLKERFNFLEILEWGKTIKADFIINTTSLGLKENDKINLDYGLLGSESFFYDVIYKPKETNFLKNAKKNGQKFQNGLMMFIHQAAESFEVWHKIKPTIDDNLINYLEND